MDYIIEKLFSMKDEKYKNFTAGLIPDVSPEKIIGVRVPDIRKLAKELAEDPERREEIDAFLNELPHNYLEENHLHGFLIDRMYDDFDEALAETDRFLPYIWSWADCDGFRPKALKKEKKRLKQYVYDCFNSSETYVIRFGLVTFLNRFLDDDFEEEMLEKVCSIKSDEYYVNMAVAWYLSMALVKQYESTIEYFEKRRLDPWIHNKALQKAVESKQVSEERKDYFRGLKIKKVII